MIADTAEMMFYEDVYLYDLNRPQNEPLAYRCANGGEKQPCLRDLLGLSAYEWMRYEDKLYSMPICLGQSGVVMLPLFDSLGRFVLVIRPGIRHETLIILAQSGYLGRIFCDSTLTAGKVPAREQEAVEGFSQTFARLRLLINSCYAVKSVAFAQECIALACEIWGVVCMPSQSAELAALQGQKYLPDMQASGQAFAISLMTLLSVMRNRAHARSGWLYAVESEGVTVLQAAFRIPSDASTHELSMLRAILEDGGVVVGERTIASAIKPPRQYAYLHKKITDPRHPYCARCGCLDARCEDCMTVQWAVLPYVCDAALLGIKNYFDRNE